MKKLIKIAIIIAILLTSLLVWSYFYYKRETNKQLTNYNKFGRITKVEIWYSLDNIEPKVIIYRMDKLPKRGQIRIISLEKYLKLKEKGELR